MRRVVTVCAWIGFLAVSPAATQARAQAQPGLKIAFISSQQILEQTPGYAAAESTFKKEYQGCQDDAPKLKQQSDTTIHPSEKQPIDQTKIPRMTESWKTRAASPHPSTRAASCAASMH